MWDLEEARHKFQYAALVKPANEHEGAFENHSILGPCGDFSNKIPPFLFRLRLGWALFTGLLVHMYLFFKK